MTFPPIILGLIFSFFSYILFSLFDASLKFQAGSYSVFQIMAVSYSFAALCGLAFAFWQKKKEGKPLAIRKPWLHLWRGLAQAGSSLLFFAGFTAMPLTDFYIFVFLIPIFVAVLSALFLKEKLSLVLVFTVLVSFAGVLVAFGPRGSFTPPYMFVLAGAVVNAVGVLLLRQLAKTEPEGIVAFTVCVFLAAGGALFSVTDWKPMTEQFLLIAAGGGVIYGIAMILVTYAFRLAPAGIASMPQFLQLVWGAILGALLFGEWPQASVYVGGAIVIAANLFLTFTQNRKKES